MEEIYCARKKGLCEASKYNFCMHPDNDCPHRDKGGLRDEMF